MFGFVMRKLFVLEKLKNIDPKIKSRIERIYGIFDEIEFVLIFWPAVLIPPFGGAAFGCYMSAITYPEYAIFFWLLFRVYLGTLILGLMISLFFSFRKIKRLIKKDLRPLIESDPDWDKTLSIIQTIDPDMIRNIRRYIPKEEEK